MESWLSRCSEWAKKLFPWSARLSILLLPWQTRWFQEGASIAGLPWEQGRLSVYGSQLFMLLTILLGFLVSRAEQKPLESTLLRSRIWIMAPILALIGLSFFSTISLRSTVEWWVEVVILVAFFITLFRTLSLHDFSFWFVLSLIPQALLGLFQTIDQRVIGTSLLGIAAQDPITRGVAVIEADGVRWLRAYGGFPHPNIFGGWLVLGLVTSYQALKRVLLTKKEVLVCYASLVLFAMALVFTYSRSAWLSLVLFIGTSILSLLVSKMETRRRRAGILLGLVSLVCILTATARPVLLFSRAQMGDRLEQKSLSERRQGIENGLRILKERPLFGSGLGANALMLSRLDEKQGFSAASPITPHVVPILIVAELGILGSLILLGVIYISSRAFLYWLVMEKKVYVSLLPISFALVPIVLLDHYLWSYWSGKMLFVIFLFIVLKMFTRDTSEVA
jgi:O-antigen ligase